MFHTYSLLGSTGSIGRQALQVAARFPGRLRVAALSAGSNAELLAKQALEFQPEVVHIGRADLEGELRAALGPAFRGEVLAGPQHLARVAAETPADLVLVATVGFTGLGPTLAALAAGRHIALANKEVLVCGGHLGMPLAREKGLHVLPVDSEHNAIFQCLACGPVEALRRVILTCSGGSFRDADAATIDTAGPAQTLRHPTWTMGSKITVDSATLMNKGFEVIEAHHLFDLPLDKIDVVIHPQSVIHSMVEYIDGSMIAQLDFFEPDHARFPALRMAYEASAAGGSLPCALNAANEVAVAAHLDGAIPCGGIPRLLRAALDAWRDRPVDTLDSLCDADREARELARGLLSAGV
mgnify:CR=1 FL=1